MTHGSLFSGIGGFDLAAEWMGWENIFHCEWNPFGQKVLNHYWPNAECFTDITKSDFTKYANRIDVLSGGFPCQPYSAAGKRLGKEDESHLWPEMLRAIREIQPRWVVGENVRGLTNWNGGMVFDEVQADLELAGYEVLPFLLPACAKDAPHRRDRIWFIAYSESQRLQRHGETGRPGGIETKIGAICTYEGIGAQNTVNSNCIRQSGGCEQPITSEKGYNIRRHIEGITSHTYVERQPGKEYRKTEPGRVTETGLPNDWSDFPTQPPVRSRNDGISPELSGITFSKHRNESIKAYGNAIVPQVAFEIFKTIQSYENKSSKSLAISNK